ncbi:tRNA epoxyqueuosine(34) reductase QueG [Fluviicola taffensis]|uniref:Epoxyqueuosine reductase n=1 Tax=Fluviicola taffensis (strain DSM 16823 / NCIMB 13979 / RW262) TaxID=755732 RepID=F2IB84_FLUTR|nr:tRNA epoxyqueuosine(34) reductase QueG [Fluviicola taffensis]AEA43170.1 iron-sulfur cluster binding protein [Fluviicola taffensis DSM 16823]
MQQDHIKRLIRTKAEKLGFLHVGFSKADFLASEEPRLVNWLKAEKHGKMSYMENHFDLRLDPRLLVPGAKTVISLAYNYFPESTQRKDTYQISKYAYGKDYHDVVKAKLRTLVSELQTEIGAVEGRVFVDSAPILEKAWAEKSGVGWLGKNGNLIQPKTGSFFFLAEIICDLEVEADGPIKDYCGSCTRCIDACPTQAIEAPYIVNGSKCISYATIELKDADLPELFRGNMNNWIYGCDICQDVCPWNRFSKPHSEIDFRPKDEILSFSKQDWEELDELAFQSIFKGSAVKRTKFSGLKRNVSFLSSTED